MKNKICGHTQPGGYQNIWELRNTGQEALLNAGIAIPVLFVFHIKFEMLTAFLGATIFATLA